MGESSRIVQICWNIMCGDGITNYVNYVDIILKKNNISTNIYAHFVQENSISDAVQVEKLSDIRLNDNDIILYHMSIGCTFNKEMLELSNHRILVFHNITPYSFMTKWSSEFENDLRTGLYDVAKTVGKYDGCITFSDFSKQTLTSEGWDPGLINVIPYFNYFESLDTEADKNYLDRFSDDYINILFVGRIIPNKRQDMLISIICSYRSKFKKKVRLILAGSTEFGPYYQHLLDFIKKFNISDVIFTNNISKSQLKACYQSADIFLCLSEHEGFCMPIIEAMYMNIPVIAYDSSAIGQTMGGAGILLDNNDPFTVGNAINDLITNEQLRKSVIEKQSKRVEQLNNTIIENKFMELINKYISSNREITNILKERKNNKIAFVVQRYGKEINGGAELECKLMAEHLSSFYDVEVLTSCVENYDTDENVYEEGVSEISGVKVRRFKAVKLRDNANFMRLGNGLDKRPDNEIEEWINEIGPCCPGLIKYLSEHSEEYKVVIFITYVFYTSIKGLNLNLKNAAFFPTAHDEGLIYLQVYRKCFDNAKGFIYNSSEEKALVDKLFRTTGKPYCITGIGIDIPDDKVNENVKEKYDLPDNYVVYAGRITEAKGCDILLEYFAEYKKRNNNDLVLVMTGKFQFGFHARMEEYIKYVGFVNDEDKNGIMSNAKALILPSKNESLSLVVLESFYFGRPVLVNGACPVLTGHCKKSNAGLYYNNYFEFEGALNFLLNNEKVYNKMSRLGKEYVKKNYSWNVVIKKLIEYIEKNF